jgi:hypothetical protein
VITAFFVGAKLRDKLKVSSPPTGLDFTGYPLIQTYNPFLSSNVLSRLHMLYPQRVMKGGTRALLPMIPLGPFFQAVHAGYVPYLMSPTNQNALSIIGPLYRVFPSLTYPRPFTPGLLGLSFLQRRFWMESQKPVLPWFNTTAPFPIGLSSLIWQEGLFRRQMQRDLSFSALHPFVSLNEQIFKLAPTTVQSVLQNIMSNLKGEHLGQLALHAEQQSIAAPITGNRLKVSRLSSAQKQEFYKALLMGVDCSHIVKLSPQERLSFTAEAVNNLAGIMGVPDKERAELSGFTSSLQSMMRSETNLIQCTSSQATPKSTGSRLLEESGQDDKRERPPISAMEHIAAARSGTIEELEPQQQQDNPSGSSELTTAPSPATTVSQPPNPIVLSNTKLKVTLIEAMNIAKCSLSKKSHLSSTERTSKEQSLEQYKTAYEQAATPEAIKAALAQFILKIATPRKSIISFFTSEFAETASAKAFNTYLNQNQELKTFLYSVMEQDEKSSFKELAKKIQEGAVGVQSGLGECRV